MIIPSKKIFMKEVNRIKNEEIRIKLSNIYDHLTGVNKLDNAKEVINEILESMFCLSKDVGILIPYSFLDSNIGRVLFSAFYGFNQSIYTINDIIDFTKSEKKPKGFTRQYIIKEINNGNIAGVFFNSNWFFYEDEINRYLLKKGLNTIEHE